MILQRVVRNLIQKVIDSGNNNSSTTNDSVQQTTSKEETVTEPKHLHQKQYNQVMHVQEVLIKMFPVM